MIIPDRAASVNPFPQTFSKTLRISMIIAKEGHMPFTLSPQQRVSGSADTAVRRWRRKTPYLRAREMAAFGGRECRCSPAGMPPSGGGDKRGQGHMWFPCPLLTPPNLPLRCDSLRSRSEMRGAHSDVWCTKGTSLMEAELFAAESGRPAPSGRALLCAANHASEIQGSSAAYKLKDARNRAPVTPV